MSHEGKRPSPEPKNSQLAARAENYNSEKRNLLFTQTQIPLSRAQTCQLAARAENIIIKRREICYFTQTQIPLSRAQTCQLAARAISIVILRRVEGVQTRKPCK